MCAACCLMALVLASYACIYVLVSWWYLLTWLLFFFLVDQNRPEKVDGARIPSFMCNWTQGQYQTDYFWEFHSAFVVVANVCATSVVVTGIDEQTCVVLTKWDRVAQWVERRTQLLVPCMTHVRVRVPSAAQEQSQSFSSEKYCVDSLSVCPTPVCIRTHENDHMRTWQ